MNKHKYLAFLLILLIVFMTVSCQETPIEINITDEAITLKEGDTYDLDVTTTDDQGFVVESQTPSILTVDEQGRLVAVSQGVATVIIRSVTDETIFITISVTVEKLVTLTLDGSAIEIIEGDLETISYSSNDDVIFLSSDNDVFTVDDEGEITAVAEGTATLTVRSVSDPSVEETMSVVVRRRIYLTIESEETMLWVGDSLTLSVDSNADVSYQSNDDMIATIDEEGQIQAVGPGEVTITVQSLYDEDISQTYTLKIYSLTESLVIEGDEMMNVETTIELAANVYPMTALQDVTWATSDPETATINADGILMAYKLGFVTVTATSVADETQIATINLLIVDTYLVSASATESSSTTYQGITYVYGTRLFSTIDEALGMAAEGATIYILSGTYEDDLTIEENDIKLMAEEGAIITSDVLVAANNIRLEGLIFEGSATVSAHLISGLVFHQNTVRNTTQSMSQTFMQLSDVNNTEITMNHFSTMKNVLNIEGVFDTLLIRENTFEHVMKAISVTADPNETITPDIDIVRNHLTDIDMGFEILPSSPTDEKLDAIVRFNTVSDYVIGAASNADIDVDFTLNYWGTETLDYEDFTGIDPMMLRGYFTAEASIPEDSELRPDVPLVIEITSEIDEIVIGETNTITYGFLPMEFSTTRIRFLTSDPVVLGVTQEGVITPLRSGTATITVRSSIDTTVNATITIVVTTTPGIEFEPTAVMSDIMVSETFDLNATPFPVSYGTEPLIYETSDPLIATIDSAGVVTTHAPGLVTITALMENHLEVTNTFTFRVYDALDMNNVLDALTSYQVTYTEAHTWVAFGQSFNYVDNRYESVSRYYFGDIEINTSKIVPVSVGIRPGEGFTPHPEGITQYNPYYAYWVVIHDTANTSPGAGALAHANYLWNLYATGQQPYVSWHYTIDSEIVYQHLPETERGYHAGDGSVLPGQSSTYFGGGNRNGIGIEMAINQDGDMYRTWQRTAKMAVDLLFQFNLPLEHIAYHNDFSGKDCPRTMRNAGLVPLFEEFTANEFYMRQHFADAEITFESHNPDLLDNHGRVITMPDRGQTVSYTITVTYEGITQSRTFYSYLPGTVK